MIRSALACLLLLAVTARADDVAPPSAVPPSAPVLAPMPPHDPPPPPTTTPAPADKIFGLGYKAGNGIGFLGGDLLISPVPHIVLDLQASAAVIGTTSSSGTSTSSTGFALAPGLQYHLFAGGRSTPYAGIGMQYVHLSVGDVTASGTGVYANLGYEWKWQSGLGIELGGGVQYLTKVTATSGSTMLVTGGQVYPNLEIGLRYMFL